ncbi:hypothetical protein YQE_10326, partial [Dendroctonus ponderosae]
MEKRFWLAVEIKTEEGAMLIAYADDLGLNRVYEMGLTVEPSKTQIVAVRSKTSRSMWMDARHLRATDLFEPIYTSIASGRARHVGTVVLETPPNTLYSSVRNIMHIGQVARMKCGVRVAEENVAELLLRSEAAGWRCSEV